MFNVERLSSLYYLAKWPKSFFKEMNEYGTIDTAKSQALFKETGAFEKLKYNFDSNENNSEILNSYRKIYGDILNLAGAAIQIIMLKDIDRIMSTSKNGTGDQRICEYIANQEYFHKAQALFGFPENIIDKVSFRIANMQLNQENLQYLKSVKSYLTDFIKESQSKLKFYREFYYKSINFLNNPTSSADLYKDGLAKIIESSLYALLQIIESQKSDSKSPAEIKPAIKSTQKTEESENKDGRSVLITPHKILSIDEAISKNFERFIGLDKVKAQLKAKYALIMKYPNKLDLNLNFRLVGNPGVGKSTMAEVMGRTFFDSGLLKNDIFNEYNGADLKAKFTGHTTAKVKEIFEKSLGGTLLIDEAYSLNAEEGHSDAFTSDATSQIVKEVELILKEQAKNPSFRTCVILAGYADKIEELMKTNSGFRRRFPNLIKLPDYTDRQLLDIFCFHMEKDGLKITKAAREELLKIFKKEREKKDFSNAGLAINLLQFAEEQQAMRTLEKRDDYVITPQDILNANQILLDEEVEEQRRQIGFGK